ncbi:hypothetical protein Lste_1168 [Legionella steelei]|uniref:Uncharacterized protein n=1 Tax=Legionella steelei TaxID=947033 RepID=A0A0W0ZGC3_9GAMM|nr:hypothetical protein Lste_1168 [Legionella steelei]
MYSKLALIHKVVFLVAGLGIRFYQLQKPLLKKCYLLSETLIDSINQALKVQKKYLNKKQHKM